jgi:hypothetical protein
MAGRGAKRGRSGKGEAGSGLLGQNPRRFRAAAAAPGLMGAMKREVRFEVRCHLRACVRASGPKLDRPNLGSCRIDTRPSTDAAYAHGLPFRPSRAGLPGSSDPLVIGAMARERIEPGGPVASRSHCRRAARRALGRPRIKRLGLRVDRLSWPSAALRRSAITRPSCRTPRPARLRRVGSALNACLRVRKRSRSRSQPALR